MRACLRKQKADIPEEHLQATLCSGLGTLTLHIGWLGMELGQGLPNGQSSGFNCHLHKLDKILCKIVEEIHVCMYLAGYT